MATPLTANEILASARRFFISKTPMDVFFQKNVVLMNAWKNRKRYTGGRTIDFPVQIGGRGAVQKFVDADDVTVTISTYLANGTTNCRHIAAPMEITETDLILVSGPEKIVDQMSASRSAVIANVQDSLGTYFFTDDPVANPKDWNSLNYMVNATAANGGTEAAPTTVLGIANNVANAADGEPAWQAKCIDATSATGLSLGGPQITKDLVRRLIYRVQQVQGEGTTLVLNRNDYERLERQIDPQVRYESTREIEALVPSFRFAGVEVTWDPHCPSTTAYLLDTKDLNFYYHPRAAMTVTDWAPLYNDTTNAKFVYRAWVRVSGNFVLTKRNGHGRLTALTA